MRNAVRVVALVLVVVILLLVQIAGNTPPVLAAPGHADWVVENTAPVQVGCGNNAYRVLTDRLNMTIGSPIIQFAVAASQSGSTGTTKYWMVQASQFTPVNNNKAGVLLNVSNSSGNYPVTGISVNAPYPMPAGTDIYLGLQWLAPGNPETNISTRVYKFQCNSNAVPVLVKGPCYDANGIGPGSDYPGTCQPISGTSVGGGSGKTFGFYRFN